MLLQCWGLQGYRGIFWKYEFTSDNNHISAVNMETCEIEDKRMAFIVCMCTRLCNLKEI